jgi:hypothetical protein
MHPGLNAVAKGRASLLCPVQRFLVAMSLRALRRNAIRSIHPAHEHRLQQVSPIRRELSFPLDRDRAGDRAGPPRTAGHRPCGPRFALSCQPFLIRRELDLNIPG